MTKDNEVDEKVLDYPTDDMLTRICELQWGGGRSEPGLVLDDVYQHDACNHTISGRIDHDGVEYGFVIHNGNWNGTEVAEWGLAEDVGTYKPEWVEPMALVPRDPFMSRERPGMFKVYGLWRKEKWFQEMERSFAYDRHFAPGGKTETYWREKAGAKGLAPGLLSNFTDEELAMIGERRPEAPRD